MSTMQYRDYVAKVEYDDAIKAFHGEVVNIQDTITFEGKSVKELEKAFRESVEDYVAFCREEDREPEKPYSGRFMLRISPELHRRLARAAKARRLSLNAYVEKSLEAGLDSCDVR